MKSLVVEDDLTSRFVLQQMLAAYGPVHIAVNGTEALDAFRRAAATTDPYDLICLDIMMPGLDGHSVLKEVRAFEEARGVDQHACTKVFMTSALADGPNVLQAFREQCEAYLVKPIERAKLVDQLRTFGLIAA
jgi:two-component system, chemotaxis family, chemotaxis protein CheY